MMNKITELYYYIAGIPYFVVYVTQNNRKVNRFIQKAVTKEKGTDLFLVSKKLKLAWWKPEATSIIIDGLKFMCFMRMDNAIPLKIVSIKEYDSSEYIIKENEYICIGEDEEKQKVDYKDGKGDTFAEIKFPPSVLHQMIEAHFIKEILSIPPNKHEWLSTVLIIAIVVLGIISFVYFA